jgi:hypothetical protein
MKEQMKEAEEAMEKKLAEQSKRLKRIAKSIREEEEGVIGKDKFSKWVSQILPDLHEFPHLLRHLLFLLYLHPNPKTELPHPHPYHHHHHFPPIKEDITKAGPRVQKEEKGRNTILK